MHTEQFKAILLWVAHYWVHLLSLATNKLHKELKTWSMQPTKATTKEYLQVGSLLSNDQVKISLPMNQCYPVNIIIQFKFL